MNQNKITLYDNNYFEIINNVIAFCSGRHHLGIGEQHIYFKRNLIEIDYQGYVKKILFKLLLDLNNVSEEIKEEIVVQMKKYLQDFDSVFFHDDPNKIKELI